MRITHDDARKLIEFSLDDSISPENRAILAGHLATCNPCQTYTREVKDVESALRMSMKKHWAVKPLPLSLDHIRGGASKRDFKVPVRGQCAKRIPHRPQHPLSARLMEQAANLDRRATEHQARVDREFATALTIMREKMTDAVTENVNKTSEYIRALSSGIQSLNGVLSQLGEKQILIHQVKKKGWFSRSE